VTDPYARLLDRWRSVVPDADDLARDLLSRYGESHRLYHDHRHLLEVLDAVDELAGSAGDLRVVRLAAWFHDAVYDPRTGDNEERSAVLATAMLPAPLGDAVARLVRLTTMHAPGSSDIDGAVLCDADLAVLGAPPQRYAAYAADVRREYAHVTDDAFRAARSQILHQLVRGSIYTTETARRRWGAQAKRNVERELSDLGGDAVPLR